MGHSSLGLTVKGGRDHSIASDRLTEVNITVIKGRYFRDLDN